MIIVSKNYLNFLIITCFLNKKIKFIDLFFKLIILKKKNLKKKKLSVKVKKIKNNSFNIFLSKKLKIKGKVCNKKHFLNKHILTKKNKNKNKFFFNKVLSRGLYSKLYFSTLFSIYTGVSINWCFINFFTICKSKKFILSCYAVNKKKVLKDFYIQNKRAFYGWYGKLSFLKDTSGFVDLIKFILNKRHLEKHKGLFFLINKILKFWFFYALKFFGVKGYCFYFKGKLGKKGSVKKTKFFRKNGLNSLTNKSLRINLKNYFALTCTGVIGCSINIFYMSMFTLVLLYISVYLFTLSLFLFYFHSKNALKSITQFSFTSLWNFINVYYNDSFIFKFLIFQLGGIAPVFTFVLKINLLALSLKYTSLIIQFFIFINLLLGVFFYLEIFFTTASSTNSYMLKIMSKESKILTKNLKKYTDFKYKFYFFFFIFFFFFGCGFFFFFDIFMLIDAFIMP